MSEWMEVISVDILDLISGYAFKSKDFKNSPDKGDLAVIKIKNVANGDVNLDKVLYHQLNENLEKYVLQKGDILIAMTGNHPHAMTQIVGGVSRYKLNEKALLNQRVGKLVAKDENSLDFFYYYFKAPENRNYLASRSSGSANQANIAKGDILGIPMIIPSPKEQQAIAEVLSSLDDKIDLLHRQNQTLEQLAETLFRQWFVEEADDSWEIGPLSSIANFLNGLACQKFPARNEVDKLPVLKIKQLRSGISGNCDWCTTDVDDKYIVQNGDVIFSWSASLMVKIWDGETCVLNQHLFKVSSPDYPKWFYYLWSKYHLDRFIAIAKAHATTMGHIKRGDLDEAMVSIPSETELNKMSSSFSPLIAKIESNNKQITTLTALRDTLLPKLMSGEIKLN
ncbi:MAG: restriction endonuclease subunit S [Leeuwenhoekiella sp.]